jgi:hypothetical protein
MELSKDIDHSEMYAIGYAKSGEKLDIARGAELSKCVNSRKAEILLYESLKLATKHNFRSEPPVYKSLPRGWLIKQP